jgi:hypothetical protein
MKEKRKGKKKEEEEENNLSYYLTSYLLTYLLTHETSLDEDRGLAFDGTLHENGQRKGTSPSKVRRLMKFHPPALPCPASAQDLATMIVVRWLPRVYADVRGVRRKGINAIGGTIISRLPETSRS